jgi:hypothetical protein
MYLSWQCIFYNHFRNFIIVGMEKLICVYRSIKVCGIVRNKVSFMTQAGFIFDMCMHILTHTHQEV